MKRIDSLAFLRFIAAFIILVFHYGSRTKLAEAAGPFITSGPQMVSLFFVLSGFVLMISRYGRDDESVGQFYIRRFSRLVPVYMLALFWMLRYVFSPSSQLHGWKAFALNLTFLQSWFPPYSTSLNYPAWAMSVQVFFYLIFPLILWYIIKSNVSWKKLVTISFLFYIFTQIILSNLLDSGFYSGNPSISHDLIFYFPLTHFCSFLLGVTGGYLFIKKAGWFSKTGFTPLFVMISVVIFTFLTLQFPDLILKPLGIHPVFGASYYSLIFIILILSLAATNNSLSKIFSFPPLVLLGESSFSLYILQLPFNIFYNGNISGFITNNLGLSTNGDFYIFSFLMIVVAISAYYLIENPGKKIILYIYQKFSKKPKTNLHN